MSLSTDSLVLAVETSCDDTCVAIVTGGGEVLTNKIASQMDHDAFGGVVPEVASRRHLELLDDVASAAVAEARVDRSDLTHVAVTQGPGLIGALLVGFSWAKAFAAAHGLPLVPVDHLRGHVAANFLAPEPFEPPFLCLVASGGHTFIADVSDRASYTVVGQTTDDAAGEAFDKGARLLGLGYPGGAALDRLASEGDDQAFDFPRTYVGELDFSFSGIKTSLLYKLKKLSPEEFALAKADLAASYQTAVVDMLVQRVADAVDQTGVDRIAIGGGVAANSQLRERITELGSAVKVPPREYCTDNAAMIGAAAIESAAVADFAALDAYPSGSHAA